MGLDNMSEIAIANVAENSFIQRKMTDEEIEKDLESQEKFAKIDAENLQKYNKFLSAKAALLEKLGITEEEAKLLFS